MTQPTDHRRNTFSSLDFTFWVQKHIGDDFVENVQVDASNPDPNTFSISELVQWGAAQVGVFIPDGADNQIAYAEARQRLLPPADALRKRGAILWTPGTMTISLGMGRTIEGVNGKVALVRGADPSRFQKAALIPGVRY